MVRYYQVFLIENAFVKEDDYELRKSVQELKDENGKFLGDFVSFLMVDKQSTPPIFYSVSSPYDLISKKDPQHALVWQGGKLLLNSDFTDYAAMRTGAVDSIALKASNIVSLQNKKILLFGTGRTTKWSLKILKVVFEDWDSIHYINSTNTQVEEFESFSLDLGVNAIVGSLGEIEDYDIIICHTNAEAPVLVAENMKRIKKGAIITTFIGSDKVNGEVYDGYYNNDANVILDWRHNYKLAKDIVRSCTPEKEIFYLNDLLSNQVSLGKDKNYSIFRFVGTPMQNLGVLQALTSSLVGTQCT